MIQPQVETDAQNENSVLPNSGTETLISRLNAKDLFINEAKCTKLNCCCCNLWIASHFWIMWDIGFRILDTVKYFFVNWSEVDDDDRHGLKNGIVYNLLMITAASIGLHGLRQCKPEYIATFVFAADIEWFRLSLEILRACIVEGRFMPVLIGLMLFGWFWYRWMTVVVQKVYKVARKHKYGKSSYHANKSSAVIK